MSTTLSMWLGISFFFLAIAAVILQSWLWGFPMEPPGDPNGKSTAPRFWVNIHRIIGLAYVVIYVVMMFEMVPRLWEYQTELPARTVFHSVAAITIGVLLVTKFAIIRFFQHFGGSLPAIGLGILLCTVTLAALSLPFAMRAHGIGARTLEPDNIERVRKALNRIEFASPASVDDLVTKNALKAGRNVLGRKCTTCHDLRTVLKKPRSAQGWYDMSLRMAEKPTLSMAISIGEVALVAAYLVAITPDLQRSLKQKKAREREQKETLSKLKTEPVVKTEKLKLEEMKEIFEEACYECHEDEELDDHGNDTREGWAEVVQRMVEENDIELTDEKARIVIDYLVTTRGARE